MINANEQRVLDVASGTFQYEGKTYRAKSSYVGQLRDKMNRDGVELTGAQADSAIQQIMNNVATGVRQGYLEETGNPGEKKDAEETGNPGEKANAEETEDKKDTGESGEEKDSVNQGDQEKTGESGEEKTSAPDVVGGQDKTGVQDHVTGQPDTAADIRVSETPLYTAALDQEHAGMENGTVAELTGGYFFRYGASTVLICILCLCAAAFVFKKIKHRRKLAGGLIGCVLMGVSVLLIGFGYLFEQEAYSAERWIQVVTETGYLKESCARATDGMCRYLGERGFSGDAVTECLDENSVYRDAKVLVSGEKNAVADVLEKRKRQMEEILAQSLTDMPEQEIQGMADDLSGIYQKELEIPWQSYLKENSENARRKNGLYILSGIFGIIASIIILIKTTKYPHRAVRAVSMVFLGTGAGFAASGAVWLFFKVSFETKPAEYGELISAYVISVIQSGLYMGILLICAGMFAGMISYFMKMRIE